MTTIAERDPEQPVVENSARRLVVHVWLQTRRLLVGWAHDFTTAAETLVIPVAFLVTLDLVFGKTISSITGHSALYGSVPMAALIGAVYGTSTGALTLMRERQDGLLDRFWTMPIHRAADLISRLAAEAIRILLTTIVVLCAGMLLGFQFRVGVPAALLWLLVPVILGVAFAVIVTTLALFLASTVLVEAISLVVALLAFFCTGFVPLERYPEWIRPVVEHQPLSYATEAMRGLSLGGPVLSPLAGTLLWSAVIIAGCAGPMVIGYRRAVLR